ncbi:DUF1772 domain-containing protein [Tsukamurella sp. PLM1]|uniref:DUF1772 domain-containing protein n=1 Tax=Tsukamurella sp. PLM1 TaxID=2929795 RepID=UPI002052FF65|nr:DUF1772 domain-containing protein [Tsukamurella sp. PLM1]BDH57876.1 hypothetical protein MTP03_28150 [Tsukamurella sp. PLM1]
MRTRVVLLALLVVFVGIQFGAGLYEKLAIVPLWAEAPPGDAFEANAESGFRTAGRVFWPFVSPVVAVLAVANVVAGSKHRGSGRRWWLAGALLMVAYAAFSYGYFVPQMLVFQSDGASWDAARIETFVHEWTSRNYLRMLIGAGGWGSAVIALAMIDIRRLDRRPQPVARERRSRNRPVQR